MGTRTLRLEDGMRVVCRWCEADHIIVSLQGNNLSWQDQEGWRGSYDAAHGPFYSDGSGVWAECPACVAKPLEDRAAILDQKIEEADRRYRAAARLGKV